MNQTKLGQIGIENIPEVKREDLFKAVLPLQNELVDAAENYGKEYLNPENIAHKIVKRIYFDGGEIYFSQEAINTYGSKKVQKASKYFQYIVKSSSFIQSSKIIILSWIADNIYDLEKMNKG